MRWATVDPNPMAQKREARKIEEQAAEAVRRALPEEFVREIEGRDPDAKRRKRIEGGFGLEGYEAPDEVWYSRSRGALTNEGAQAQIADGEERYLIEDERIDQDDSGGTAGVDDGSILPRSTLAALQSYSSQHHEKGFTTAKPAEKMAGPLVTYGSDEDSD